MVALDPSPPVARRGDLASSSAGLACLDAQPDCVVGRSLLLRRCYLDAPPDCVVVERNLPSPASFYLDALPDCVEGGLPLEEPHVGCG